MAGAKVRNGGNHDTLVTIKNRYDPKNLFRLNHNIQPAAAV